ncbi:MAG: hypothetical protein JNL17_02440 [Cyclobacteriaceae bacterium]|nr:hypothetical protein [Cyclobacteriaceae bacterium]
MKLAAKNYTIITGLLFGVFLLASAAHAQDIRTANLVWKIDSAVNLTTNKGVPYHAEIKTFKDKKLIWSQKGGERVSEYTVVRVEGEWQSVKAGGTVTYFLTKEGHPCEMKFERVTGGISITVVYGSAGKSSFLVSTINESTL